MPYKLKDSVDFKDLKKLGFHNFSDEAYLNNHMDIIIKISTRTINVGHCREDKWIIEDAKKEDIKDLITAGLVEEIDLK